MIRRQADDGKDSQKDAESNHERPEPVPGIMAAPIWPVLPAGAEATDSSQSEDKLHHSRIVA